MSMVIAGYIFLVSIHFESKKMNKLIKKILKTPENPKYIK